jgi:RNase H-fold protein (predicted Holliday junction resolvase)
VILAIDPGRDKCGLALLESGGVVVWQRIVERPALAAELSTLCADPPATVVIGSGTTSRELVPVLAALFGAERVAVVDERGSTLEARTLYFMDHPPAGLWRLLPRGLVPPPRALDDYAAVVLGRRFLAGRPAAE